MDIQPLPDAESKDAATSSCKLANASCKRWETRNNVSCRN